MKKFFTVVALAFLMSTSLFAQEYRSFGVHLGVGYAAPSDGGGGILAGLEPFYRINDQIAVGLRLESAAMAKIVGTSEAEISAVGSYTLNGKYYFTESGFRPYVGLGLGIFSLGNVSSDISVNGSSASSSEIAFGNEFGFYPRIGFDAGHFNFNIDYNIIGSTVAESLTVDSSGNTTISQTDVKNSYIGIRIGAFIGGGNN